MKLICFSLWGNNPLYTAGAMRNAEIAKELFPDWICRFYIANTVPTLVSTRLESMENCQVVRRSSPGTPHSMFWRFEPAFDPSVDYMISRDTDSRLGIREKSAIDDWVESGKKFHIMRDHPYHGMPIMGGMWGCKPVLSDDVKNLSYKWLEIQPDKKGSDQEFLRHVYEKLSSEDVHVHDEFFENKPFPMSRDDDPLVKFIGQVFDENDNYAGDWENDLKELGIDV